MKAKNSIVRLLGERCNQLLKDKGDLTDKVAELGKENTELKSELTKAKDLIQNIIRVTWGEGWNYSLDWKAKAEQFLKGENIILEDAQVGNSPFDADEVFNKEMKAYPEEK